MGLAVQLPAYQRNRRGALCRCHTSRRCGQRICPAYVFPLGLVAAPDWSVPGFHLEQVLGEGGMGIVYRAQREADGAVIALKRFPRRSWGPKGRSRDCYEKRACCVSLTIPTSSSSNGSGTPAGDFLRRGLTITGHVAGTSGFMAPEQITDFDRSGRRPTNSAGAMLYYLRCGEKIYDFPPELENQLLMILQEKPVPIHSRLQDIPAELAAIIVRALAALRIVLKTSARCTKHSVRSPRRRRSEENR